MSGARVGAKRDREMSPDPLHVASSDEDEIISSKAAKKARAVQVGRCHILTFHTHAMSLLTCCLVQQSMEKEDVMKSLADLDYKAKKLDYKEKKLDIANHRRELEEQVSAFTRKTV